MRRSHLHPLVVRQNRKKPSQRPLTVLALPYRTRERSVQAEGLSKSLSSGNSSGITARKCACSTVFGDMATTLRRTHTSPPSSYRGPSMTGTGERFRRSERVPASRDGYSTTHTRTGDGIRSRLTSRKKSAPLRKERGRRHRYEAPDDEGEGKRGTARRANKNKGTRNLFTGSYRLRPYSSQ